MPNSYLGQIQVYSFNFAPREWALCQGQLLPIAQNTALFSLLGTYYGGDGRKTFGLPDLQGIASLKYGRGPGLSTYVIGQRAGQGQGSVVLNELQIPLHSHSANAVGDNADSDSPAGTALATSESNVYHATADTPMAADMIKQTGGNQGHNNMLPYLVNNWCICLQGEYPSRS